MESDEEMTADDNKFFQSIKYRDFIPIHEFHFKNSNGSIVRTRMVSKFLTTKYYIIWGEYNNDYLMVTRINVNNSNTTYRNIRIIKV